MIGAASIGRDSSVRLGDGRRVAWREYGKSSGPAVFALHGLPGSRLKFSACDAPASRSGLRIIAPDRWGYGSTDPHPDPSLQAFADDIAAVADHLGLAQFAVMGVSAGGPYAAAVAAALSGRVTAAALVSPVGPIAGERDIGIGAFHRFCFGPLARSPLALRSVFAPYRRLMLSNPSAGLAISMARIPAADRRILATAGVRDRLCDTFEEGVKPGVGGLCTDMAIFGRSWDVDLSQSRAPARVWIGDADRNVPIEAAKGLAKKLPQCEVVILNGEGHLWVALHYADVLDWIAGHIRGTAGQITAVSSRGASAEGEG